jgi:hypothetical protein
MAARQKHTTLSVDIDYIIGFGMKIVFGRSKQGDIGSLSSFIFGLLLFLRLLETSRPTSTFVDSPCSTCRVCARLDKFGHEWWRWKFESNLIVKLSAV